MATTKPTAATVPAAKPDITLLDVTVITKMNLPANATVSLELDDRHITKQCTGVGGVDAIYKAICALVPHDAEFLVSHVDNAKQSIGSEGIAHVRADFKKDGALIVGEGSDMDTLVASAKAFIDALNQIRCFGKGPPC